MIKIKFIANIYTQILHDDDNYDNDDDNYNREK
jgi:hypothetical protein